MFAPYAAMKFGIEAFSEKTAVVYHCSGQSDETNLHLILQNVHKNIHNIKLCFLSPSGRISLQGSKRSLHYSPFFLLTLTRRSIQCPYPFCFSFATLLSLLKEINSLVMCMCLGFSPHSFPSHFPLNH